MRIEVRERLSHPAHVVFRALRDDLRGILPHLPNIREIEQKEREELADGVVRIVNVWKAEADIPRVARGVVKPEMLEWTDTAEWDERDLTCAWTIRTGFFPDRIRCQGRNAYVDGRGDRGGSELSVEGDLTIEAKGIPGVPALLASQVGAVVERFAVSLIAPNYRTMARGLERYLAS